MHKIFIFLFCLSTCFNLHGGGRTDSISHYLQLRITNLTNSDVQYYFNDFTYPSKLEAYQSNVTKNFPMLYEFPGFLLITRNNVITEIYRWVQIGLWQGYYHVLIYDDKVEFYSIDTVDFDGGNYNIDNRYRAKFEEDIKERGILSGQWNKYAINDDNSISIEIENRSGGEILTISNGLNFGPEGTLGNTEILKNNEIYKYRINDLVFSLKYLSFRIRYIKGISESNYGNIVYNFEQTDDYIILYNNNRQRNIKIIINHYDSGYEIKFP